jgi:hypothetical protein
MKMTPPYPKDAMAAMMNVDTAVKILSLMLGQSHGNRGFGTRALRLRPDFETEGQVTAPPCKKPGASGQPHSERAMGRAAKRDACDCSYARD